MKKRSTQHTLVRENGSPAERLFEEGVVEGSFGTGGLNITGLQIFGEEEQRKVSAHVLSALRIQRLPIGVCISVNKGGTAFIRPLHIAEGVF